MKKGGVQMLWLRSIAPYRPDSSFGVLSLIVLLFCATVGPHPATAGYHTSLHIEANDNTSSYYRPSPDYEKTIEDVFKASGAVGYDDGRLSEPYKYPMLATAEAAFDLTTGAISFYIDCMGMDASSDATVQMTDTILPFWESGSGPMEIQLT
jgi:hypothetical protein